MLSQSGYREVESTFITRYEQLLAELEQLWRRFEAEYEARDYVAARRSDIIAWQAVQQWLGTRRAAFLSYFVLKDCVAAFLILPDRTEPLSWQIPISKRRLEDIASRFALEVGVPGSSEETWLALAQPLTAQIAQAVAGVDILYVSKHGALHPLPVHALLWNEQSSAAAVPVAYANGIGTLLQIEARHQALTPPEGGAVIIGDPCGDLPEAGREAQEIAEMFGVKPLIGLDASVKNVRTAIHCGAVRTIHFAAHSTFDEADPNSSGIVLADGVLRARDIGWDRLHSQMVVVSGCSSGRSGASSGDEQWGLTRAFSLAGVANTVIALWDIEDASAGSIMLEFYRRLLVQSDTPASVARALLAAMLGQRARKPQTRYWSPFAFYGA
jgi:CHAT domain-containing protein